VKLSVPALDVEAAKATVARDEVLTKPRGALGQLERVPVQLAAIQGGPPASRPAACLIFAADHAVTKHGVSAYPSEVTAAMVRNFVDGGAAASVLCRHLGVALRVVDVGVEELSLPFSETFHQDPVASDPGGDLRVEDAMSEDTFARAWHAGAAAIDRLDETPKVVVLGEMGIGNTTAASAVAATILGRPADAMVGPGTGVDGEGRIRKLAVVEDALRRVGIVAPLEALRRLGGRELVAVAGAAARAATKRIAILADGYIVCAALLALVEHEPRIAGSLIFGHRSREPGHRAVLDRLAELQRERDVVAEARMRPQVPAGPLLELDLALGEGTGALAALPLLDLACGLHAEMATFVSAGVPDRD